MKFTNKDLDGAIADLGMLKFFPSDATVQGSIKAYLAKLCPHKESLLWLVNTLVNQTGEWPGSADVRRILASRYRPADGDKGDRPKLEAEDVDWAKFPSHAEEHALPPAEPKLLEAPLGAGGEMGTVPDRAVHEIFSDVLDHFSKPWPRPTPKLESELRVREDALAREVAESGRHLTDEQKRARILEIESSLGDLTGVQ